MEPLHHLCLGTGLRQNFHVLRLSVATVMWHSRRRTSEVEGHADTFARGADGLHLEDATAGRFDDDRGRQL